VVDIRAFLWPLLFALAALEVLARRRLGVATAPRRVAPRSAWWAVVAVAAGVGAIRAPLALGRTSHNVDEAQYAASADHARRTGESLFGPRNLGGHQWLYLLGSLDDPYTAVDLATSVAVAATGALLGLTLLRAGREPAAAWLAPVVYALGMAPLEGGSSNKEAWVGLCAAGWAFVRLRPGPTSWQHQLGGGAWLGLAVLMKEQAGPLVLAEAALLAFDAVQARAWRPALRDAVVAGAGFWLGLSPLLVGLAAHGALGGFFGFLRDMGAHGGTPILDLCRVIEVPPPPPPEPWPLDVRVLQVLGGLTPLAASAVGFLGLWLAARVAGELHRPPPLPEAKGEEQAGPADVRLEVGLAALGLFGLAAASIGQRWFAHYLLLAVPGLAGLAAVRLVELARAARETATPARWTLLGGAALAALAALHDALFVAVVPSTWEGHGGDPEELRLVASALRRLTSDDDTVFVWGWRPELYLEARRRPASRYVCGLTATRREALDDLRRERPAAIVLPGLGGLAAGEEFDPYDLAHHPPLVAWLRAEGYAPAARVEDHVILTRRAP